MIASEVVAQSRWVLRCLWATFLSTSGCLWWAKHSLRKQGSVVVLMLHRVLDDAEFRQTHSTTDILVRKKTFHDLTAHLASSCEVVPLVHTDPGLVTDKPRVILTFDDGWSDNYQHVLPRLQELNLPSTVFVCSGVFGEELPFWTERTAQLMRRLHPVPTAQAIDGTIEALKLQAPEQRATRLRELRQKVDAEELRCEVDRVLSLSEIQEMAQSGVSFGSHTHTHPILTTLPLAEARKELEISRAQLEAALGTPCRTFTYPNGNWSMEIRDAVEQAGFQLALTTQPGPWTEQSDPMAIPRVNISEENISGWTGRFSAAMFEYQVFWKSWRARRKQPLPTGVCPVAAPLPESSPKAARPRLVS